MLRRGLGILALLLVAGCGTSSRLCAVQGAVTLKGAPLDQGTISFYVAGSPSPAGGALIQNGRYTIPAEQGLEAGTYRVTINSTIGSDLTPAEYAAGKKPAPPQERIPAAYNTQSQHTVNVERGKANQFDFRIE